MEKHKDLVLKEYTYRESLPFYEGNLNGKDFPIIIDSNRLGRSKIWIRPVVGCITGEDCEAVASGKMGKSELHVHEAEMVYLLLGEQESVTAEVTLGDDVYKVTTLTSVLIPAGLAHGIRATQVKEGLFGGICSIYYEGEYAAQPVPENPLQMGDTEHLVIQGYRWSDSLSSHEGSVEGKGFPIMLSSEHVKEASTWICPAMPPHTPEMCEAINSGAGYASASPHYHNEDEMYLILGDEGCITLRIGLDDEVYDVAPPSAVYLPVKVVHSLNPIQAEVGKFGGSCGIVMGKDYITIPK